jgi:hypothetical protein
MVKLHHAWWQMSKITTCENSDQKLLPVVKILKEPMLLALSLLFSMLLFG